VRERRGELVSIVVGGEGARSEGAWGWGGVAGSSLLLGERDGRVIVVVGG
jgi:hypothetical protein